MSRLGLPALLAIPLRPAFGSAAEIHSAKIWAKRSARTSNGCEERLGMVQLCCFGIALQEASNLRDGLQQGRLDYSADVSPFTSATPTVVAPPIIATATSKIDSTPVTVRMWKAHHKSTASNASSAVPINPMSTLRPRRLLIFSEVNRTRPTPGASNT